MHVLLFCGAATQQNDAATQQTDAATQQTDAATQQNVAATQQNVAATQQNVAQLARKRREQQIAVAMRQCLKDSRLREV